MSAEIGGMAVVFRLGELATTDDELERVGRLNPHLRVERAPTGELILSPPAGGWAGHCGIQFAFQVESWNRRVRYGVVYDASTGFRLPHGALRSPDLAVVAQERIDAIPMSVQMRWLPVCPDLVIEIRSPNDDADDLSAKLRMFRDNGAAVALSFDPRGTVEIHDTSGVARKHTPERIELWLPGAADPFTIELGDLYRFSSPA